MARPLSAHSRALCPLPTGDPFRKFHVDTHWVCAATCKSNSRSLTRLLYSRARPSPFHREVVAREALTRREPQPGWLRYGRHQAGPRSPPRTSPQQIAALPRVLGTRKPPLPAVGATWAGDVDPARPASLRPPRSRALQVHSRCTPRERDYIYTQLTPGCDTKGIACTPNRCMMASAAILRPF